MRWFGKVFSVIIHVVVALAFLIFSPFLIKEYLPSKLSLFT